MKIARGLFIIYQMIDGGVRTTDGTRVTMLHWHRTKLHGLGIKGKQTVCQQLTDACEVLQRLCG